MKDKRDETNREEITPTDQGPVSFPPEIRAIGTIVLACIGAVFVALTYRLVRWIAGF